MRVILLLLASFALAPAAARPIAADDYFAWRYVSEPRLSPDGEWVAYAVSFSDKERDEETSDVWMSRVDGGGSVQLTSSPAAESAPRWSPDGRMLAFLSDRDSEDGISRIWALDRRGGEARLLADTPHSIGDFAFSPDGRRIVFVATVEPEAPDDDRPRPIVIDRFFFKEDVTGYLYGQRAHLFLLDVEGGTVTQLTDGPFDNMQPAWSPDGGRIAFVSKRGGEDPDRHENWDIWVVDAKAGATPRRVTISPGRDGDPEVTADGGWGSGAPDWSPDGRRITYLHGGAPADIWYGLVQAGVIGADGEGLELPTAALDRNTWHPRWSADGKSLYFLLEDDMSVYLARVRVGGGKVERLTAAGQVVRAFDVGRDGRAVYVSSSPVQPGEVFTLDGGEPRKVSAQNDAWLDGVDLVAATTFTAESADGLDIRGLYLDPRADRGKPAPLILRIHGGPVGQFQHDFDFEWQVMAAAGYVVAGANPRGSSGRGYEFQKVLFADWGYADVPDILAASDRLVEAGVADADRQGIGGWSYGGILTNYMIASTDRFRAAVSGAGMSNMLGGYGIDQYVREWELELGKPWENTDTWLRLSYPFLEAGRITTPTLFMCGAADFNVPLPASEQMYQALRSVGVPTRLVIYPDEYHSLTRPSFQQDKLARYLDWYDRHLK